MNAYVLIGAQNSRKSSVCRALTGCYQTSIREVQPLTGPTMRALARPTSLQETNTTPSEFVTEAKNRGVHTVLFCLWPHARLRNPHDFPNAEGYLSHLIGTGWNLKKIAVLGQSELDLGAAVPTKIIQSFPETFIHPTNVTTAGVRAFFGWI